MSTTVATTAALQTDLPTLTRVPTSTARELVALDAHMFNPHPSTWLLLNDLNRAIHGPAPESLTAGLAAIGHGGVAAVAGRLRDGVGVVDVDVNDADPGHRGRYLTTAAVDWLTDQGCWVLVRPSGGAPGRAHVFFAHTEFHYAPTTQRQGLALHATEFLTGLAEEVGVRPVDLTIRDTVRTLTSPHRRGSHPLPTADLTSALESLRSVLPDAPQPVVLRRRRKLVHGPTTHGTRISTAGEPGETSDPANAGVVDAAAGAAVTTETTPAGVVPLIPIPRARRPVLPEWRTYLRTGHPPVGDAGTTARAGGDRSLTEARLTLELVWAGYDAKDAWSLVRTAAPGAMTKARSHGHAWWVAYVWNPAVTDANAFSSNPRHTRLDAPPPPAVADAITYARHRLESAKWDFPRGQRRALLLVGHHLLDRALRERRLRVPCPERNLVLDTGLTDRKTIRRVLRDIDGVLGKLHTDTLDTGRRASTSYEFEFAHAPHESSTQIPPPVSHPPLTPPTPGYWACSPPPTHSVWRALLATPTPTTVCELTTAAGLTEAPHTTPTSRQVAAAQRALDFLREAGMAAQDPSGRWMCASTAPSGRVASRAASYYAAHCNAIQAEREAYRRGGASSWHTGRARVARRDRQRQQAWWQHLPPTERTARTQDRRVAFERLTIAEQASVKAALATRRCLTGGLEQDHHNSWLATVTPDELVCRTLRRQQRFQSLSPNERAMAVASWERHRQRFGISRT